MLQYLIHKAQEMEPVEGRPPYLWLAVHAWYEGALQTAGPTRPATMTPGLGNTPGSGRTASLAGRRQNHRQHHFGTKPGGKRGVGQNKTGQARY